MYRHEEIEIIMEFIMMRINAHWHWLGPLLLGCLVVMLAWVIMDIVRGEYSEKRDRYV